MATIQTTEPKEKAGLNGRAILAIVAGATLALGAGGLAVYRLANPKPMEGKPSLTPEEEALLARARKAKAEAESKGNRGVQAEAGTGIRVDEYGNILGNDPTGTPYDLKNQNLDQFSGGGKGNAPQALESKYDVGGGINYNAPPRAMQYNAERAHDEREQDKESRSLASATSLSYSSNPRASWAATRPQGAQERQKTPGPYGDTLDGINRTLETAQNALAQEGQLIQKINAGAPSGSSGGGAVAGKSSGNAMPAQRMAVPAGPGELADMRIGGGPDDIIREGKFLDGVLVNRIESDIAESPVMVQLSRDFLSLDGKQVLFPAGAMCYGVAGTVGNMQQTRMYVNFHKVVFPRRPGERYQSVAYFPTRYLPPIMDAAGSVGVSDKVDRHFMLKFGSALVLGVFDGLGAALRQSGAAANTTAGAQVAAQASQNFAQVMGNIVAAYANVVPTVTIPVGKKVKIYFTQDTVVSGFMDSRNLSFVRAR